MFNQDTKDSHPSYGPRVVQNWQPLYLWNIYDDGRLLIYSGQFSEKYTCISIYLRRYLAGRSVV